MKERALSMQQITKNFFKFLLFLILMGLPLEAAYQNIFSATTQGGLSWTGNTLGLSKAAGQNQPGTLSSIGTFITTDTSSQVGTYPPGTTLNWMLNSSSAVLDLPPGSTVLNARLIWGGSFGFDPTVVGPVLNTPIQFTTPDNVVHSVSPATSQSILLNGGPNGIYVRSNDVTALVLSQGAGVYTVGGVPGTAAAGENALNCCGWTLAVAYQNPNMLTSILNIYVGAEGNGAAASLVTGFQAPTSGPNVSRLFTSSFEGDPDIQGDRFLVGPTLPLVYPTNALFGSNNPQNNFFCSQINTLLPIVVDITSGKLVSSGSSLLDTRGTFGLLNSNAGTGVVGSGVRQGYDITSIDLGSSISPGQTQLYAQGTSAGDAYVVNSLGIQIQVSAPVITASKQVSPNIVGALGDTVTFTLTFTNNGQTTASNLVLTDILPAGLTYVNNSLTINSIPSGSQNLTTGVPLGNLAIGDTVTVVFQASVTSIYPPTSYENTGSVSYEYLLFNNPVIQTGNAQTNSVTVSTANILPPVANDDNFTSQANTTLNGTTVLVNDTGVNLQVISFTAPTQVGSTVTVQPDGTFVYQPANNFSGIDTFTYTISDSINQTDTATVFITVLPSAQPDNGTVAANTTLNQAISVLNNDFGTGLIVSSYTSNTTQGGIVSMLPTGTYTYNPPLNFSGLDTFNYTITDSTGNTSTTSVTIVVLPAAADDFGVTPANTVLNGTTVFTNDIGTGLTIISYTPVSAQGGTVVMNTTFGTYVYTPPLNYSGTDTFTYTVQDSQGNINTATVTITVLPVAVNDSGVTTVDTPFNGSSVLANDLGSNLVVSGYTPNSTQGGTVVLNNISGTYVYVPPINFSGSDNFTYTIRDTLNNISVGTVVITVLPNATNDTATTPANTTLIGQSVLTNDSGSTLSIFSFQNLSDQGGVVSMNTNGTFTYMPPLNFSGIDQFVYTLQDSSGGTSQGTMTITVTPLALPNSYQTIENTPLNGSSVLTNDVGTGLFISSYQSNTVQGGTVVMNTTTGTFVYTPPTDFVGIDSFSYFVSDSSGGTAVSSATINVISITPIVITSTTPVNTPTSGNVLEDFPGFVITNYQNPTTQGGFISLTPEGIYYYIPPQNFIGEDSFIFSAINSQGDVINGTLIINVTPVNPSKPNPPTDFIGKVKKQKFLNRTEDCLKATWNPSTSSDVVFYRIYYKGKVVDEVSAKSRLVFVSCLDSKKCANAYFIAAVNRANTESNLVKIRIIHD